jgi:tetratricopeptide (TPR) repeat protein
VRLLCFCLAALGAQAWAGGDVRSFQAIRRLEAQVASASVETELALQYFLLGQRELFHAAIAKALELDPRSAQAYYLAGRFALEAEQDPQAASRAFRQALEWAPESFKAHYYLGICLRQMARHDEARRELRRAGETAAYGWPWRALAEMELDLHHYQAAREAARKALELEPQAAENALLAGKVYQALGQPEKALPLFEEAARMEPLWEKPHFLIGTLYLAKPATRQQGAHELERFRQLESIEHPARAIPPRPAPQAKSRAELDAFGRIVETPDSLAVVRAGEDFLSRFPDSEFREKALEAEFEAFRQRNDSAAAKAVARSILAIDSGNALVLARLALLLAEANDRASFAAAEQSATQAIAAVEATARPERLTRAEFREWRSEVLASAHVAKGLLALRQGQADAAIDRLEQAIRCRAAGNGSDYLRLGEAFVMKGDRERARDAFARAESLGPPVVAGAARRQAQDLAVGGAAAFQQARALEKEGRLREAAAQYEQLVRQPHAPAEAHHNLGLVYYRLGDYARAAKQLHAALASKPDLAASHLFLGLAQFRLGDFENSAKHLEAMLRADPRSRESYLFLIRDQTALGRFRPETAEQALRLFPQDSELGYTIGLACLERIREIARAANEAGPDSPAFLWLSLRRAEERRQADAVARYRQRTARSDEPELIQEYDRLAGLLKHSFDHVLERDPESAAAHGIRGYLHESHNEVDEALAEYRLAGDHFAAGRLLAQHVRLKEAETELEAALAENPQNDRARADLGRLYLQEDLPAKALAILRQIARKYPGDAYAWADLGKAEARLGSAKEAVQSLQKALELDPSLNQIHYQLGMLYRQQGNESLAREELQRFRTNRKSSP